MMETIGWSGYTWIPQRRWGKFNHHKPYWWYDPSAIHIDDNDDVAHLYTHVNPKTFEVDGKTYLPTMGAGMLSCQTDMSYGTYIIKAKLPQGPYLWPAFWLSHVDHWPPEIDVMEAYSNSGGSYWNLSWPFWWHVETNLWYRDSGKAKDRGAMRGRISLCKPPHRRFIEYRVMWEPNSVRIYYDNRLVREVTNYLMLDKLNDDPRMYVTINNGIRTGFYPTEKSDFQIKYFRYIPY